MNFGGGGISIFCDNGNENAAPFGVKKSKIEEAQGKMAPKKRAALGVITNTTRVQPSRAAKQGQGECFGNENEQPKQGKVFGSSQGFSIHLDENSFGKPPTAPLQGEADLGRENPFSFRPAPSFSSQNVIEIGDSPTTKGSPMVLDNSVDLGRVQDESPEQRFDRLLSVTEYADEVYTYLREFEKKHRPKPSYMRRQPDITNVMRCVLVDWLVEVAEEYKLHRETLCLCINYIDRFLSHMSVLRGKLQLVGAASMFLASKFEEIYPPEVTEFVYITDDTYTKKQVLRMEHLILKVLSFDVAIPTFNYFCDKFAKDMNADDRTKNLSFFLGELTLVDADPFLKYLPSEIAAASLCLANITLGNEPWPTSLQQKTRYQMAEFQECLRDLHQLYCRAADHPQQAIREKYKQDKFNQVSLISPPASLPGVQ